MQSGAGNGIVLPEGHGRALGSPDSSLDTIVELPSITTIFHCSASYGALAVPCKDREPNREAPFAPAVSPSGTGSAACQRAKYLFNHLDGNEPIIVDRAGSFETDGTC